jgi:hypothetical protein
MIKVYSKRAACFKRVPFILFLNTAAFSDIQEAESYMCDNLAMLGGTEENRGH